MLGRLKSALSLAGKLVKLREYLEHLKRLQNMLPICNNCAKIRDDIGYREQIDSYILRHSDTRFSHGICPDCYRKLYGE